MAKADFPTLWVITNGNPSFSKRLSWRSENKNGLHA